MIGIRLAGKYEPLDSPSRSNDGFTYVSLNEETVQFARSNGHRYVYIAFWASSLKHEELAEGRALLRMTEPFGFHFSLGTLPKIVAFRPKTYIVFDGRPSYESYSSNNFVSGNNLCIRVSTECEDCSRQHLFEAGRKAAYRVRTSLGLTAAFSLSFDFIHDTEKNQVSAFSEERFLLPGEFDTGSDISALAKFLSPSIGAECLRIDPKAEEMLQVALSAATGWQRFILLWFCIEIQIGDEVGRRRRFCKEELKSSLLNDEMGRLALVRASIVHHGSVKISPGDLESIMWMFRVTCLPSSELRRTLVRGYERWLLKQE